jgi:hypothetical protein
MSLSDATGHQRLRAISSRIGRHETTYLAPKPESALETRLYIARQSRADHWSNRFPHSPRLGSRARRMWSTNRRAAVHIVSTQLSTFGGKWLCQNRLTGRVAAYSVPSTKPPDGRHACRGRLAMPMSLEVSSFSCMVRQRSPLARVELRASKRYGVCRGDGRPGVNWPVNGQ